MKTTIHTDGGTRYVTYYHGGALWQDFICDIKTGAEMSGDEYQRLYCAWAKDRYALDGDIRDVQFRFEYDGGLSDVTPGNTSLEVCVRFSDGRPDQVFHEAYEVLFLNSLLAFAKVQP